MIHKFISQNLSPGLVITEMVDAVAEHFNVNEKNKCLEALDIANACITVLNTPPNVLVCFAYNTQIIQFFIF